MITAFTVKNFKAIGDEPVRIELKPITLLFGANSVGKSSILHALNYAYSVFCNRNLNAEYNVNSSSSFNLGSFSRFVYRNDIKHSVVLGFELSFQAENDIPKECLSFHLTEDNPHNISPYDYSYKGFDNKNTKPIELLANVKTAFVEVEISWNYDQKIPYVSRYITGLDGEWIAKIYADGYGKKTSIRGFNTKHPVFNDPNIGNLFNLLIKDFVKPRCYFDNLTEQDQDDSDFTSRYKFGLVVDQKDALPNFNLSLIFGEVWQDRCDD